jgi:hypothetical protein
MIPCAVTVLVLYFPLFFISRGLDTNRSIVGASHYPEHAMKRADSSSSYAPCNVPIHLPHDNTHLIHCIVISPPPLRGPFLLLFRVRLDGRRGNQPTEVTARRGGLVSSLNPP